MKDRNRRQDSKKRKKQIAIYNTSSENSPSAQRLKKRENKKDKTTHSVIEEI
jgi:hypothetical protein